MVAVKVTVIEKSVQEIEAEFPIFRHHEIDTDGYPSTDIWTRIDFVEGSVKGHERFTHCTLTRRPLSWGDGLEYEMESGGYSFNAGSVDYALGRGEYASSETEFEEAVDEAMAWAVKKFKGDRS